MIKNEIYFNLRKSPKSQLIIEMEVNLGIYDVQMNFNDNYFY